MVTLSVSSSTSGSSTLTVSPGFLNHWPIVASLTNSPSAGTLISVAIVIAPRLEPSPNASSSSVFSSRWCLLIRPVAVDAEDGAPGVARPLDLGIDVVERPFDVRLHECPGSHVLRLFLAPHHLGILEARQFADQRLVRERIDLLDAHQIDIVDAAPEAFLVEIEIDLAGAQHHPP